jgi:hypothetical protein
LAQQDEGDVPAAGGTLLVLLGLLREHLRPQFAYLDNIVCRDVQPSRGLANGLGTWRLIKAVGLLLVRTQEREQPLDADIGVNLSDLHDVVPLHL